MNIVYFSSLDDIDDNWKVRISKNHSEFISCCNSSHHVTNFTSNCSKDSISLFFLKPHPKFNSILFVFELLFSNLEWNVFKAFGNFAKWAFNSNISGFDINGNLIKYR